MKATKATKVFALLTVALVLVACGKPSSSQNDEDLMLETAAGKATGGKNSTIPMDQQVSSALTNLFPTADESSMSSLKSEGNRAISASRGFVVPTPYTYGVYRVNFKVGPYRTATVSGCGPSGCNVCGFWGCLY